MDKLEVNIIDASADDVLMPGMGIKIDDEDISEKEILESTKSTTDIISKGIEKALSGETVKSVLIPEDISIVQPNYVIDLSKLTEIDPIQAMALDAILNEDGDMAVYIYTPGELEKIGMGYSWMLNRIIVSAIGNVFDNKCLIYRNYAVDRELEIVDSKNIVHLRLSI